MKKALRVATTGMLALTLAVMSVSFGVMSSDAEATIQPGYNGRIVYRNGNNIYTMEADGSNIQQIAVNGAYPKWSPDGEKIVFSRQVAGDSEIFIVNADGSNETQLTFSIGTDDAYPDWSPDGSKITFTSRRDGNSEIYVMDPDGSNQTNISNESGLDFMSQWSPDGSKIAYYRGGRVWLMNPNGSNKTSFDNGRFADQGNPLRWSPDGKYINFQSYPYVFQVDVVDTQTGISSALTDNDPVYSHWCNNGYHWSPDSKHLAACKLNWSEWDDFSLVVINAETGEIENFALQAEGVYAIEDLIWSPDGRYIYMTAWDEGWNVGSIKAFDTQNHNITTIAQGTSMYQAHWLSTPNAPPIATDDTTTAPFNTPKLVDVLANDTDEEALSGSNLSVITPPAHGTASVVNGKIRYAPTLGYQGSDSLVYQICDSFLLDQKCSTGVVSLTVSAPIAPSLVITNVNGEHFEAGINKYTTTSLRPTFSGTATPGSEIRVEIHSDPIVLTTTTDGDGNWSVTPAFDLPTGEHMVYVSASLAGFTTTLDEFGLTIGTLASTGVSMWLGVTLGVGSLGAGIYTLRYANKKNLE